MRRGSKRKTRRPGRPAGVFGFTLVEMIIVVAVLMLVSAIAAPQLKILFLRSKVETQLQALTQVFQVARSQAVRSNVSVAVGINFARFDSGAQQFVTLEAHPLDDLPGGFCSTDIRQALAFARININQLPVMGALDTRPWEDTGTGVVGFEPTTDWDPGMVPCWPGNVDGFAVPDYNIAVYMPDGSLSNEGGFRFGDGTNFFELRIAPAATAKIQILKFVPNPNRFGLAEGYYTSRVNDVYVWEWVWE